MKIESDRLIIRSFRLDDIPDYHRIVSDPRVTRFLRNSSPHSYEEAEQYVQKTIEEERRTGIARYAVERKDEGKLIGFCGFADIDEQIDFGWRYESACWGRGYGTEAALAVLNYGVSVLRLKRIVAGTAVENVASLRIIEKLGFDGPEYFEIQGRRVARYYKK